MSLLSWLQRNIQWTTEHRAAWAGMSISRDGNLSRFQELARDALVAACRKRGLADPSCELKFVGSKEPYITGVLSDCREYWIYTDGAGIEDQRLEEWDFRSPDDLISEFLAGLSQPLRSPAA